MPFPGEDASVVRRLKDVAQAFVQLHDKREKADYDDTIYWALTEALREVKLAEESFKTWYSIRTAATAQAYVASLLLKGPKGS